ncbi:L-fucose/L-arabinose isomerase family protein [Lentilitoribacter sp. Alg239-R112]|uniref:L-fucose/L-arabinose isomerase family protein n=1 Tax=Lentilitoribacter sp. Alg239-R112 TaxID=2305987 RepID=UPI001575563E|nr:L-fucose/L-arabinose isomerase family protein [Lentilitoribacter sp. Alg239-R112]
MSKIWIIASGDLRESANVMCWPAQKAMEDKLSAVLGGMGYSTQRAHPVKSEGHGFISSQREGMDVFAEIDAEAPIIVAEAVWQYSHHVLAGLVSHRGPILTLANWSGQWPGLVGMLNLNGSLVKAGVKFSTLWSENFDDAFFLNALQEWLKTETISHDLSHVRSAELNALSDRDRELAKDIADDIRQNKVILGVFDEGCMGMYNAIIPDELLMPMGIYKERLSQSALYYETNQVSESEAIRVFEWLKARGLKFHFGTNHATELTEAQVLDQCRMYIAAVRIAEEFGCEAIGIQYQQGLKDLLPASDLVEGMLNNTDRPDVTGGDGTPIRPDKPIVHFNEVDECAGLDAVLINRVHHALGQPLETTLHDLRWGDVDQSGSCTDFVWVFEISGAVPPAHNKGGWAGSESYRQPAMFFPNGGGTLKGIAKSGEIIWSRIFVENNALHMDIGRGQAVDLPEEETERRSKGTTSEWPIMHGVLTGVTRDQMMARHRANHIQVVYAHSAEEADHALSVRAALAKELGISVHYCGI